MSYFCKKILNFNAYVRAYIRLSFGIERNARFCFTQDYTVNKIIIYLWNEVLWSSIAHAYY